MIPLNITMASRCGVTVLSNRFIDNYMTKANDAQIKVYLYLLRMVSENLPTDISDMADKFNFTEKDVKKALEYWNKNGLMSSEYDEDGTLISIIINDIDNNDSKKAESIPEIKESAECVRVVSVEKEVIRDYQKEKDEYSIEDLKRIKSEPEVTMLINVGSAYVGRPLSPAEIRTVVFIYDRLGFSMDLESYLIECCVDAGQTSFHYIEQVAINWFEQGISTVESAKSYVKQGDKESYAIMEILGKSGKITEKELEYIRRWKFEYGFSMDMIKEACGRAKLWSDGNRFGYTDGILEKWKNKNIHSLADVKKADKDFDDAKKANQQVFKKAVGFGAQESKKQASFEQRDYDFDALEKAFLRKGRNS